VNDYSGRLIAYDRELHLDAFGSARRRRHRWSHPRQRPPRGRSYGHRNRHRIREWQPRAPSPVRRRRPRPV